VNQRLGKRKRLMIPKDQKPNASGDTSYPSGQEQHRSSGPSAEVTSGGGSKNHAPETKNQRGKSQKENRRCYLTTVLALVAAIAGVIAGIAGGYQAYFARDTEHISNRAYVTATAFQLINYGQKVNGHTQWTLRPIIENTGNTSTRFLEMKETVSGGVGRQWNFQYIMKKEKFTPYVISPRSTTLGSTFIFNLGLLGILQPIIAAGVIKYGDVFGDRHLTEYCYEFASGDPIDWDNYPIGQPIRISGATFIEGCQKHNCEDDECGADWRERAR
jgi:hypothetical protein